MIEIIGNLWDYYGKPNFVVLITTNGTVKSNGECVMGRGCAAEAKKRWPRLSLELGNRIRSAGNHGFTFFPDGVNNGRLGTFPVKHNWWEKADLALIATSTERLVEEAIEDNKLTFVLPRPGCGNGHLQWSEVKPLLEILPDNVRVITY